MYYFLSYHGAVVESVPTERVDGVRSPPGAAFGKTFFFGFAPRMLLNSPFCPLYAFHLIN